MKKKISGILALIMFLSVFINTFSIKAEATANYVTAIRDVNPSVITPDGEAEVKVKVRSKPPVNVVKPNDVVLVLDKSESMQYDNKFEAMKDSAKEFVNLMDFSKHNLGVVDFSYTEYSGTKGLTNDPNSLKNYIDGIECVGGTDTGYAIREAAKLLKSGRSDAQPVIVLLTDGQANSSSDALKAAEEAKNAGIVFYTVALLAPGENADTSEPNMLLKDMATTSSHHHFVLGSVGLIDIYRAIVKEIGIASAYNVKITEEVSPEFEIVLGSYDNNIPKPQVDGNTLTWNILELKADTLELSYKIRPKSDTVAGKYNVVSKSTIAYKDYEGNEQIHYIPTIHNKVLTIRNYPPVITSVTNNSSHANGGEKIIIKGSNFIKGAKVSINKNACTNVVFIDSNTIEAVTPPGVQGNTTIKVTNYDGQEATSDFSYYGNQDITITKITPNSGSLYGGNIIYIYGTNFINGDDLSVEIGGNKAALESFHSSGKISVRVPANSALGKYDVVFTNGDGQKLTIKEGYEYLTPPPAPTISQITPNVGSTIGGELVYINGANFLNGDNLSVEIGGNKSDNIYMYNSTRMRVRIPANSTPGKYDVVLTNGDGQKVTIKEGYEYVTPPPPPAPTISQIKPNVGTTNGGELVYIYGANFVKGDKLSVEIGGNKAEINYMPDSTKIRVKAPANSTPGKYDVVVTNGDGQQVTVKDGYEYVTPPPPPAPTISQIKPNVGTTKGGELVYIYGANFVKGNELSVEIGGNKAEINYMPDSTMIRVKAPANSTPGKCDVVVTSGDGQKVTVKDGYEYVTPPPPPAPTISQIKPNVGTTNGGELVYIYGANFVNGDKLSVEIGGNKAAVNYMPDSTMIRVKAPANSTPGKCDVVVTSGDGQKVTVKDGYEYVTPPPPPAPTISQIKPNVGTTNGGELVYIYGANFVNGDKLSVEIGGNKAAVNYMPDSTMIRVKAPANSTPGKCDVVVTSGDGQKVTVKDGYEYVTPPPPPAPTISQITPNVGSTNGGDLVYINGTNFVNGDELSVEIGGNKVKVNYMYGPNKIRIKTPANSAPGKYDVVLTNGDGQKVTIKEGYEYIAP